MWGGAVLLHHCDDIQRKHLHSTFTLLATYLEMSVRCTKKACASHHHRQRLFCHSLLLLLLLGVPCFQPIPTNGDALWDPERIGKRIARPNQGSFPAAHSIGMSSSSSGGGVDGLHQTRLIDPSISTTLTGMAVHPMTSKPNVYWKLGRCYEIQHDESNMMPNYQVNSPPTLD